MLVQSILPNTTLSRPTTSAIPDLPGDTGRLNFAYLLQTQGNSNHKIPVAELPGTKPFASYSGNSHQASLISLGSLTGKSTTVAQLLLENPALKASTWSIIHDPVNKHKAFTQIPYGSQVYFNPQTRELSWNRPQSSHNRLVINKQTGKTIQQHPLKKSPIVSQTDSKRPVQRLDEAVKHLMGTNYDKIDCYTLVVEGLKKMGIRYRGKDSVSQELLQRARREACGRRTLNQGNW